MSKTGKIVAAIFLLLLCLMTASQAQAEGETQAFILNSFTIGEICRTETLVIPYDASAGPEIRGEEIAITISEGLKSFQEGVRSSGQRTFYLDLMEEDPDASVLICSMMAYCEKRDDGSYRPGQWVVYYINPDVVESDGTLELYLNFFLCVHPEDMTTVCPFDLLRYEFLIRGQKGGAVK